MLRLTLLKLPRAILLDGWDVTDGVTAKQKQALHATCQNMSRKLGEQGKVHVRLRYVMHGAAQEARHGAKRWRRAARRLLMQRGTQSCSAWCVQWYTAGGRGCVAGEFCRGAVARPGCCDREKFQPQIPLRANPDS